MKWQTMAFNSHQPCSLNYCWFVNIDLDGRWLISNFFSQCNIVFTKTVFYLVYSDYFDIWIKWLHSQTLVTFLTVIFGVWATGLATYCAILIFDLTVCQVGSGIFSFSRTWVANLSIEITIITAWLMKYHNAWSYDLDWHLGFYVFSAHMTAYNNQGLSGSPVLCC